MSGNIHEMSGLVDVDMLEEDFGMDHETPPKRSPTRDEG